MRGWGGWGVGCIYQRVRGGLKALWYLALDKVGRGLLHPISALPIGNRDQPKWVEGAGVGQVVPQDPPPPPHPPRTPTKTQ